MFCQAEVPLVFAGDKPWKPYENKGMTDPRYPKLARLLVNYSTQLKKGERISAEEEHLLDLLSTLIEKYEDEHYPIEPSLPHEILQHLMEARGLKQKDIVHLFGSSGRASEAINGLRPISKIQAKALAEFFHVSTDLFLSV